MQNDKIKNESRYRKGYKCWVRIGCHRFTEIINAKDKEFKVM